jgi:gas vesicle protein
MSNNVSKILIAAAAGLAAGVALGLLFAPDKGTETRKKVRKFIDDLTDELGETLEEKFGPVRDAFRKEASAATEEPGDGKPGK